MHRRQKISSLAFQTAHGRQMRQPPPNKYKPPLIGQPPLKMKIF